MPFLGVVSFYWYTFLLTLFPHLHYLPPPRILDISVEGTYLYFFYIKYMIMILGHFKKINNSILSTSSNEALIIKMHCFKGMERVASITSSYYKFAEAAILVFALVRNLVGWEKFTVKSKDFILINVCIFFLLVKIFLIKERTCPHYKNYSLCLRLILILCDQEVVTHIT